ncbi:hypothetical protein A3K73_05105 [Candidatus Pacearchaeota archaeon RBG_13_36_9]|nr:MAG: hypothetical protein A3K73_05105 [Candidatus Pacearchaeota archaeon RBG_13_36_9]
MPRNIFEELGNAEDGKEKAKILERFWLVEERAPEEDVEIIRKGIKILDFGNDREKIIALQVISRAHGFPISDRFEGLVDKEKKRASVEYEELMEIVERCLEFLSNENGNLRLAAANCLHYLTINLNCFDCIELFYNFLSLKEFCKDKKKTKTIEFCLEKIYSPHLEALIEAALPLAVKKMKINVHSGDKETARKLENFANSLIKETEKFIPEILNLRGEYLLEESMIPYVVNIELFQISYELQKISELAEKKQLDDELSDVYAKFRLSLLLKQVLEKIRDVEDKERLICVDINLSKNQVFLTTLENVYSRFDKVYQGLSKFSDWETAGN